LAEKAGCSQNHLASIETLRKAPSFDLLDKIALALKVSSWRLFLDPENPLSTQEISEVVGKSVFEEVKKGVSSVLASWDQQNE
jgi:transcriptional regulator with XRE-family HTH domain